MAADPEVIVCMPCGFDLIQTRQAVAELANKPGWQGLQAVQQGRVYLTDGNQYFNRPGPRLVDSLEILTEILHPQSCHFGYQGTGWLPWIDYDAR
jgi:iron complex transport system substrate-binding protein